MSGLFLPFKNRWKKLKEGILNYRFRNQVDQYHILSLNPDLSDGGFAKNNTTKYSPKRGFILCVGLRAFQKISEKALDHNRWPDIFLPNASMKTTVVGSFYYVRVVECWISNIPHQETQNFFRNDFLTVSRLSFYNVYGGIACFSKTEPIPHWLVLRMFLHLETMQYKHSDITKNTTIDLILFTIKIRFTHNDKFWWRPPPYA